MRNCELVVALSEESQIITACDAGADAVCMSFRGILQTYGEKGAAAALLAQVKNVHSIGKKYYVGFDFFAHNEDVRMLKKYCAIWDREPAGSLFDGAEVYDPGVFSLVKSGLPSVPVHIGVAMNVTNDTVCGMWQELSAARVCLAHVLSEDQICRIGEATHGRIELEVLLYGIPCITYSGRKLLGAFLDECNKTAREDARYAVTEEQRPGRYFPLREDARGSYIYDADEENRLSAASAFTACGITAFRVEGQLYGKSRLAEVVQSCRQTLDRLW